MTHKGLKITPSDRNRVERVQKRRSEKKGNKETMSFLGVFVAYVEKLK